MKNNKITIAESVFKNYKEEKPPIGIEVIAYCPQWINEDYNRSGMRVGFLNENNDGPFVSARYDTYFDSYEDCAEEYPEKWVHFPNPAQITPSSEAPNITDDQTDGGEVQNKESIVMENTKLTISESEKAKKWWHLLRFSKQLELATKYFGNIIQRHGGVNDSEIIHIYISEHPQTDNLQVEAVSLLSGLVTDVSNLLGEYDIEWQQAGYYTAAKEFLSKIAATPTPKIPISDKLRDTPQVEPDSRGGESVEEAAQHSHPNTSAYEANCNGIGCTSCNNGCKKP